MAQWLLRSVAARLSPGSNPGVRLTKMVEIIKKILKEYFEAIFSGRKNFEVRIEDDCKYSEGDILILKEINSDGFFTGRELRKEITYVLRLKGSSLWSKDKVDKYGFTVLSIK